MIVYAVHLKSNSYAFFFTQVRVYCRFDCRGYLQDLKGHDADSIVHGIECQANEDAEVEKLCEYERYLELQTDVHEVSLLQGEYVRSEHEKSLQLALLAIISVASLLAATFFPFRVLAFCRSVNHYFHFAQLG